MKEMDEGVYEIHNKFEEVSYIRFLHGITGTRIDLNGKRPLGWLMLTTNGNWTFTVDNYAPEKPFKTKSEAIEECLEYIKENILNQPED